jgi:hypothetical protein
VDGETLARPPFLARVRGVLTAETITTSFGDLGVTGIIFGEEIMQEEVCFVFCSF